MFPTDSLLDDFDLLLFLLDRRRNRLRRRHRSWLDNLHLIVLVIHINIFFVKVGSRRSIRRSSNFLDWRGLILLLRFPLSLPTSTSTGTGIGTGIGTSTGIGTGTETRTRSCQSFPLPLPTIPSRL